MSEIERAAQVKEFWLAGKSANQNWIDRAKEALKFYFGNQWDDDTLAILKEQGRPALTINRIMPIVNLISGFQRQNRQDITVLPKKGGLRPIADVLTVLVKHTMDMSNAEYEQSMAFLWGVITGKGWLGFDANYEHDPLNGDLVIESIDPLDMIEDREHKKYDLNHGAKFVIRSHWIDKTMLELLYPKKKAEIGEVVDELTAGEGSDHVIATYDPEEYQGTDNVQNLHKRYTYRVRETWWKDFKRILFLVDQTNGELLRVPKGKKAHAVAITRAAPERWTMIERVAPVMMMTKSIGDVVLEDIEDPMDGITLYPFIRFCPYMLGDNIMGMVDNLIDPQREHNKRRSQLLHILNTSANSGFIVDEGALSPEQKENVEQFGNKPGVLIEKRPGKEFQRLIPVPLSAGHMTIAVQSANDLRDISGASPNLQGFKEEASESGKAIFLRQKTGLAINEIVFDNYNYSLQIFGNTLVEFIRKGRGDQKSLLYSDAEISQIVEEEKLNIDINVLRSFGVGRYGIKVAQSQSHPTARMAQFEQLLEAIKMGLPVDPVFVLEASDLPNKEKMIEDIKQKQALAQQQAALAAGAVSPDQGSSSKGVQPVPVAG